MTLSIFPNTVRGLTWPVMKSDEFATLVESSPDFFETRLAQSQNPIWHFTLIYEYLKNDPADILASLSPYTDYEVLRGFLLGMQGKFSEFLFDDLYDDFVGVRAMPGGASSFASGFHLGSYPTQEFFYPLGSYVVDNNTTPHLQQVTIPGIAGTTFPSFSAIGGTTLAGPVLTFQDRGVFPGANAQTVPLVNDGAGNYYSPVQRGMGGYFSEDVTDLNTTNYPLYVWANGVLQTGGGVNYTLMGPGLSIPSYSYYGMYVKWASAPTGPITMLGQYYFRVRLEDDRHDIEQFLQRLWTIGGTDSKNGSGMLNFRTSRVAQL